MQQPVQILASLLLARLSSVWMGENGIEFRGLGTLTHWSWEEIACVERHRFAGLGYIRICRRGKRKAAFFPIYEAKAQAFYREAAKWLGAAPVATPAEIMLPASVAQTQTALLPPEANKPQVQLRHNRL